MPVFNQSRSRTIRLIFVVAFILLLAQLINLQLLSSDYAKLAMNQAVFEKIVYPQRGIIYDNKGKAILNNTIMYDLMVTPSEIQSFDTVTFCALMEIDTAGFKKRMNDLIFKNGRMRPSIFQALLSPQMQARIEESSWRFPGFVVVERPVRNYPYNIGAHILGYINEVSAKDIEKSNNFYRQGDYTGKTGLESYYEKVLMGRRGVEYLLKDNFNRLVGKYENGKLDSQALAGRGLHTYIDLKLQEKAEKMISGKLGAVVAIDPKTGGILAMASGPTFDPNMLTGYDKGKNYANLVTDVAGPLFNRAINGRYEPGSTFKPLGALVALSEGRITPSYGYGCGGRYNACGSGKPKCSHAGGGHAGNLRVAIANSCNSYFSHMYRIVVDNPKYENVKEGYMVWKKYLNAFGLGQRLGVDLPGENTGNIPDTSVYNKDYNGAWNSCTNLTLGIGQDKMGASPLQLANAMCIIANKGFYYTPHLVKKFEDETIEDTALLKKFRTKHNVLTHIPDSAFSAVIDGMEGVVLFGTARLARIPGIKVCAKTGTAENYAVVNKRRIKLKDNSLFVCFAPKDDPKIAVAVVVQNAGYGATWAGPIARVLMEQYLLDTLTSRGKVDFDKVSKANIMPPHLARLQKVEDSVRAFEWFRMTKDSAYIRKYIRKPPPVETEEEKEAKMKKEEEDKKAKELESKKKKGENDKKKPVKDSINTSAAIDNKSRYESFFKQQFIYTA